MFYEQYLTVVRDTAMNLGFSLGAIFLVTFFLMGFDLWTAVIILVSRCLVCVKFAVFARLCPWEVHTHTRTHTHIDIGTCPQCPQNSACVYVCVCVDVCV